MITRDKTAINIKVGFLFDVAKTVLNTVVFGHSFDCSLTSGIATFVGATAFLTTHDFLTSEEEYIDERTKESN